MPDTERPPEMPKRSAGRPPKYYPERCDEIIAHGKLGMTVVEMADAMEVAVQTLYNWSNLHADFNDAFTRAQEAAEACWARKVREGLEKPPAEFQGAANLKYMAQRFKGWSEKAHVDTKDIGAAEDAETPDSRTAARRVAMLLAKGVQKVD